MDRTTELINWVIEKYLVDDSIPHISMPQRRELSELNDLQLILLCEMDEQPPSVSDYIYSRLM